MGMFTQEQLIEFMEEAEAAVIANETLLENFIVMRQSPVVYVGGADPLDELTTQVNDSRTYYHNLLLGRVIAVGATT
jgi:hypothetical protein